ncbi:30S ribosomal protein S9 [Candidatus Peregrinibacteria bacterium CG_4_9_14_0_2_um_filter_53_11]|nr:MAG: 30S ribosomal protein S9 [Candidatus Peregrinibacteria bacterium CG_4_9_14_0_2_um_filter_53_11]
MESEQPKNPYFYAVGKRKRAVATVRLITQGVGEITVNGRSLEDYFTVPSQQEVILSPLRITEKRTSFDITVKVQGGGLSAQAEAIRHGISRALTDSDLGLRSTLKHVGFLRRDSRIKERKKYGLKRARRAPQFSKR